MKKCIIGFSILIIISACSKNNNNLSDTDREYLKSNIISKPAIKKQISSSRNYVKPPNVIMKIKLNKIYSPSLGALYKEYIFIVDYSSMFIHRISLKDTSNKLIFGKGKGRGPGELINPTDCHLDDDKIFISDVVKGTVEVYSIDGMFINSIKLKECLPYKFIINNRDKELIVNNEHDLIHYFYKYDYNGMLINKFGVPLVNKNLKSGLYHELNICKLSDSSFLQIPVRLGLMGYYRNDSLLYVKETIDGMQDLKNMYRREKEHVNTNNFLYTCLMPSSNSNVILMARLIAKNGVKKSSFDIYDKKTLNYLYSFKLPTKIRYIKINDEYLVTYNTTHISILKRLSDKVCKPSK